MSLPELDTVSFDAELPLSLRPFDDYNAKLARETRLGLRILAAPTENREGSDPQMQRLEAKLDLALEVALFSRHPDSPPLHPCRLGLGRIAWQSACEQQTDSPVLLTLSPHADSALTLFLPAHISSNQISARQNYIYIASIDAALDENTRHLWEKWIFRRHREQIRQRV
ncbi:PilZ domain-containing protein [Craterilacuibacter sp.]|uniref:PilZ domain-containing protein n=1 Tax=Craterilacuibacter sp. TaxID=2870909 RepID=UPI003F32F0FC